MSVPGEVGVTLSLSSSVPALCCPCFQGFSHSRQLREAFWGFFLRTWTMCDHPESVLGVVLCSWVHRSALASRSRTRSSHTSSYILSTIRILSCYCLRCSCSSLSQSGRTLTQPIQQQIIKNWGCCCKCPRSCNPKEKPNPDHSTCCTQNHVTKPLLLLGFIPCFGKLIPESSSWLWGDGLPHLSWQDLLKSMENSCRFHE